MKGSSDSLAARQEALEQANRVLELKYLQVRGENLRLIVQMAEDNNRLLRKVQSTDHRRPGSRSRSTECRLWRSYRRYQRSDVRMRAALYARVSTKGGEQDTEVQFLQLRRYAELKGYRAIDEYMDECSGKRPVRPGPMRLEKDAEARRFDVIVVVRIDRIMRSLPHFLNLIEALERHGARIESSSDGIDYSTPTGRLIRNILASVAEFEGQLIVERTKEGLAKATKGGHFPGRPRVWIDLDRFHKLMEQPGMTKAKACGMLGYSPGAVNNRLKEIEQSGQLA